MKGALPAAARRNVLKGARATLVGIPPPPAAAVPVSAAGWVSSLHDASLAEPRALLCDELERLSRAETAGLLRMAANDLAEAGLRLASDLWCLAALRPRGGDEAVRLREAVLRLATLGLNVAEQKAEQGSLRSARRAVDEAARELAATRTGLCDDPCREAFGVPLDKARDARGAFAVNRVLAAWHGRYEELARRLTALLAPITDEPPGVLNAVWPAAALVLTDRPLLTLRSALAVRSMIDEAFTNATNRITPLRTLKLRVDRSRASHAGILQVLRALQTTRSDSERALLRLDLYRRVVEGQLRPWSWALLQIRGRSGPQPPELAAMREQLVADGRQVMLDAAAAILPAARNAAAHEDAWWDGEGNVLRVGETTATLDELDDATERAYAVMSGAENALACARAASPRLEALLDVDDPRDGLPTMNEMQALNYFGTNGLLVRTAYHDGSTLTIELDSLRVEQGNSCIQALMWASRYLSSTERFRIVTPGYALDALNLQRPALDATFVVWQEARALFDVMPPSTFLPSGAWARLAVELPEESARATAWLALNDALHAYDEQNNPAVSNAVRSARLAGYLSVVASAVAATMTVLPHAACGPLHEVFQLVDEAAHWSWSNAQGRTSGPSSALERRARALHAAWPAPAAFPTIDPRPLA